MQKKRVIAGVLAVLLSFGFTVLSMAIPSTATQISAKPKINDKVIALEIGETYKLKIKGANGKVTWKSQDKNIAKVSKKGLVTAKSVGTTNVIAKVDGKKLKCKVMVVKYFTSIALDKEELSLKVGDTYQFTVTTTPDINEVSEEIKWGTSDPNVVKVDDNGKIEAVGDGVATIQVYGSQSWAVLKDECIVTVSSIKINVPQAPYDDGKVNLTHISATTTPSILGGYDVKISLVGKVSSLTLLKSVTLDLLDENGNRVGTGTIRGDKNGLLIDDYVMYGVPAGTYTLEIQPL